MTPLFKLFLFLLGMLMFLGSSQLTQPDNSLIFDLILAVVGLGGLFFVLASAIGIAKAD